MGADGRRLGVNAYYRLKASAPRSYTFRIRITETNRADPDPTNDEASRVITVRASSTATRAGAVVATPTRPVAGKAYALVLPLFAAGRPVTPTTVRCAATLRGKALRGAAARLTVRARCTWRIPADARGARLAAKLTASAGGRTFSAARTNRVR